MSQDIKKILLVDSDPQTIQGIQASLEANNCQIETVGDGLQALERIRKQRPDLVVYDVMMPKMSGMQFLEALKAAQNGRRIPVILLSSRPSMEQFFQWMDIDCFLSKPIKEEELLNKISIALGRPMRLTAAVGPVPTHGGTAQPGTATISSTAKKAIVVGVEEFILRKLVGYLESTGYEIEIAMDEDQTLQMVPKVRPQIVFIQYWEDDRRLNTVHLAQQLAAKKQPYVIYCASSLAPDVMKNFSHSQMLPYTDSADLIRKTEAFLK